VEQRLTLAAVIAHEMDGIKGCGGTLAKYSQMGHRAVTETLRLTPAIKDWDSLGWSRAWLGQGRIRTRKNGKEC